MKNPLTDPRLAEFRRFLKFGITGVGNTLVDFFVFTVLSYIGVSPYLSQVVSYAAGMLNSYAVNRKWTFGSKDAFFGPQMRRFLLVNLSLLALSLLVLRIAMGVFGIGRLPAKLCTTAFTVIFGFLLNRLWVFRA